MKALSSVECEGLIRKEVLDMTVRVNQIRRGAADLTLDYDSAL